MPACARGAQKGQRGQILCQWSCRHEPTACMLRASLLALSVFLSLALSSLFHLASGRNVCQENTAARRSISLHPRGRLVARFIPSSLSPEAKAKRVLGCSLGGSQECQAALDTHLTLLLGQLECWAVLMGSVWARARVRASAPARSWAHRPRRCLDFFL